MVDRDYYNVLGVERGAAPDRIKRAYRRLAMRWHPDRNAGDQIAEQRFKQVNDAYRVLSDPLERTRYDRLGPLYDLQEQPHRADELKAAVRRAWRDLVGRKARGDDLHYTIRITLEQAARGVSREIVAPRRVVCQECLGLGAPAPQRHVCEVCQGTGRAKNLLRSHCFHCGGRGYLIDTPCQSCEGSGLIEREETVRIKVPPGVDTGARLRVPERGHESVVQGAAGDLFVLVDVAGHDVFIRAGRDLLVKLPLSVAEAAVGAEVTVPTLDGTTWIRVPPRTAPGHRLRLTGRGMPAQGELPAGDLLVEVDLELPEAMDASEVEALQQWFRMLPPDRHPRRARWNQTMKERR